MGLKRTYNDLEKSDLVDIKTFGDNIFWAAQAVHEFTYDTVCYNNSKTTMCIWNDVTQTYHEVTSNTDADIRIHSFFLTTRQCK